MDARGALLLQTHVNRRFFSQPQTRFIHSVRLLQTTEIQFVDNMKYKDLEAHDMNLRTGRDNF